MGKRRERKATNPRERVLLTGPSPRGIALSLFACAIGFAVSLYLTDKHLDIVTGRYAESSLCSISATLDCDSVSASDHAEWFGLPVAGFGALFYLLLAVLQVLALADRTRLLLATLLGLAFSALGTAISLILLAIMVFSLRQLCLFCLLMDLCTLGLTLGYLLAGRGQLKEAGGLPTLWYLLRRQRESHASSLLILLTVGGLALFVLQRVVTKQTDELAPPAAEAAAKYQREPLSEVRPDPDHLLVGSPEAPLQLVEFTDFECPACARASSYLDLYRRRYGQDLAIYFYNYPLDAACNPEVPRRMHPNACLAAKIALCLRHIQPGASYGYTHETFAAQRKLDPGTLRRLAVNAGASEADLEHCLGDPAVQGWLDHDLAQAQRLRIEATPTMFLNGRPFKFWPSPRDAEAVFEHVLQGATRP
ncbi:MAG: hypothetical protein A2284_09075 [Deltaproteobacteria bacterium RIFOXYA12_FULL_61_11]|nr:MAG: hypothetical protein A2284_09075 [Deltaproteobacteria bacterium RIFOXYA12_FULL_61_11]